ncbi:hypothetical protein JVU11DRAFT_12452 [Chiua virens]|nr:hypothetical protein JVU11DRAFT_12452 [Chiua virens]
MDSEVVRVLQAIHPDASVDLLRLLNSFGALPDSLVEVRYRLRNNLLASPLSSVSVAGLPTSPSPSSRTRTPTSVSPASSTLYGVPRVKPCRQDDAQPGRLASPTPAQDLDSPLPASLLSRLDSRSSSVRSQLPAGLLNLPSSVTQRSERLRTKPYEKPGKLVKVANRCPARGALPPEKPKKPKKSKQKDQTASWVPRSAPHFQKLEDLDGLIGLLGSAASSATTWVHEISQAYGALSADPHSLRSIAEQCQDLDSGTAVDQVSSLSSIVGQCRNLQQKSIRVDFAFMISCMRLTLKCQSIRVQTKQNLEGIFEKELGGSCNVGFQTFSRWHSAGSKFARVAAGGSLYLLILIAGLGLQKALTKMLGNLPLEFGNLLRTPPKESPSRRIIASNIVPSISCMMEAWPIPMAEMFPSEGLPSQFVSKDLENTDVFFDHFKTNSFGLIDRDVALWEPCYMKGSEPLSFLRLVTFAEPQTPMHFQSGRQSNYKLPTSPLLTLPSPCSTIHTLFDCSHQANMSFPIPHEPTQREEWTQHERQLAEGAPVIKDLKDFKDKVASMYPKGVKHAQGQYIRVPMAVLGGSNIDIRCSDGSLLAFISTSMPPHLRDMLCDLLALICPASSFSPTAQEVASDKYDHPAKDFRAMHWSWYFKYGTSGEGAPEDIHPYYLDRDGCTRTNHSQFIPYLSQETFDHEETYHLFTEGFGVILEWLQQTLKSWLPEEYKIIAQVASVLPENAPSPVHPFTSLVLNFNACTRAHRDCGDLLFCLVLPIGHFQGGSLVLVEPGLVLDLRQGPLLSYTQTVPWKNGGKTRIIGTITFTRGASRKEIQIARIRRYSADLSYFIIRDRPTIAYLMFCLLFHLKL